MGEKPRELVTVKPFGDKSDTCRTMGSAFAVASTTDSKAYLTFMRLLLAKQQTHFFVGQQMPERFLEVATEEEKKKRTCQIFNRRDHDV